MVSTSGTSRGCANASPTCQARKTAHAVVDRAEQDLAAGDWGPHSPAELRYAMNGRDTETTQAILTDAPHATTVRIGEAGRATASLHAMPAQTAGKGAFKPLFLFLITV
jgi:hypothetical protein